MLLVLRLAGAILLGFAGGLFGALILRAAFFLLGGLSLLFFFGFDIVELEGVDLKLGVIDGRDGLVVLIGSVRRRCRYLFVLLAAKAGQGVGIVDEVAVVLQHVQP